MKRRNVKKSKRQNGERRNRPWHRRAGVVVVFLIVGAIINVLVAWVYVGSLTPSMDYEQLWPPRRDYTNWWGSHAPAHFPREPRREGYIQKSFGMTEATLAEGNKGTSLASYQCIVVRQGLPCRAFEGATWYDNTPYLFESGFIVIGGMFLDLRKPTVVTHQGLVAIGGSIIPVRPVWRGFLINSVFYGAFVWMLFALPLAVRRHWREKRNRCPDCGYDLRGADHGKCPECGEAVVGKRRQPNSRTADSRTAEQPTAEQPNSRTKDRSRCRLIGFPPARE